MFNKFILKISSATSSRSFALSNEIDTSLCDAGNSDIAVNFENEYFSNIGYLYLSV